MEKSISVHQAKLDEEMWTEVRRLRQGLQRGYEYWGDSIIEVYKKFGEAALECFDTVMSMGAERFVLSAIENFKIPGNDARTIGAYFKLADKIIFDVDLDFIEDTEKRVIFRVYPPCILFPKNIAEAPAVICHRLMGHERTACRLINPKLKLIVNKLMTAGDPYCEIGFELED